MKEVSVWDTSMKYIFHLIHFIEFYQIASMGIICIQKEKYKKGLKVHKTTIHVQITVTAAMHYPPLMQNILKPLIQH